MIEEPYLLRADHPVLRPPDASDSIVEMAIVPSSACRGPARLASAVAALLLASTLAADEIVPPIPPDRVLEESNAVIGRIIIDNQNIFDLENPKEDNALFRFANRIHIRTRPSTIRAQLLFESGDPYRRRLLDESERILRSNSYLYEAEIVPVSYADGRVDVRVFTRDVWTLKPGLSFSRSGGKNRASIELEEENFLGRGGGLSVGRSTDEERDSTFFQYSDKHLGGSWLALGLTWANNSDGHARALNIEHPFYALDTRRAAGAGFADELREDPVYEEGDEIARFRHDIDYLEAHYGWSDGLRDGWARRWFAGIVRDEHGFEPAPGEPEPLVIPEDRKLIYPFVGFQLVQDHYWKGENLDQIRQTEDFALGTQLTLRLGWSDPAFGADRSALVFSGEVGRGFGDPASKLLLLSGWTAGRLESGDLANALLGGSARFYLRQSEKHLFFMALGGDVAEDLDVDNVIDIGGDNGLRGYPLRYQRGTARALFTIEQRRFTDYYLFRLFRVGAAAFFDAGRTWGDNPQGLDSRGWLRDVGIGLRLNSTRSSLGKMIHIDLAFPLDGDDDIDEVQLLLEGKRSF